VFLYIDPLKQGLKPGESLGLNPATALFLYIDPLKQGLKLHKFFSVNSADNVFIHRSIKTRIETGLLYLFN